MEFVFDLVGQWSYQRGRIRGLRGGRGSRLTSERGYLGEAAMREVLTMEDAFALAGRMAPSAGGTGGTGQGIIGALGSVGLRVGGEFGRFVDMPGLRELGETVSGERLAAMGIEVERGGAGGISRGGPGGENDSYKTLGWVRPRLSKGKAVLTVEWGERQ